MTAQPRFDLAVIGSGAAGFAAAIAARGTGHTVAMIEAGTVGGTCVNIGCVPSKALLAAAEARHTAADQAFPGIATSAGEIDLAALIGAKDRLVESMRASKYIGLADDYDWPIMTGTARFADGPVLEVTRPDGSVRTVQAGRYLIATGAQPTVPPIDGLADAGYLTSTGAMDLTGLPASMLVLGGGAIGLEQAQLFARLGVTVTVVEALDRLAPAEEPQLSAAIERVFREDGITIRTGVTVDAVHRDTAGYTLTGTRRGRPVQLQAEQLLVATGRRPNTAGLNLAAVGVKTGPAGEVVVDQHLATHNPRIWAAGDVTGHAQYVYVAAAQGKLVADNALRGDDAPLRALDFRTLPRVTFTSPAIASVGLTDEQAAAEGIACQCRVLSLDQLPRAIVNRDTRGVIKLVAEQGTGRLLGAHVVADGAGDVITAATYALAGQLTVQQIADQWHPYLTMAEGLKLTAQAFARDTSKLSCCAA